jgi:pyrroline-5-carboxylate reductase
MKITFIGGGNMATALIGGLKKQGFSAAGMQVVDPLEETRTRLTDDFGVRCTPAIDAAALNCEALVLAVKPQLMKQAVAAAAGRLGDQLVISVAAGLQLKDIARWLGGHDQIVRAMPNTPALIGAGIAGLYAPAAVGREGRASAEKILKAVGHVLWIEDEALMDVVTAVSGSGPAYVFYFIEALQNSGTALGLPPATARRLAVETFLGAARLAAASDEPVDDLRMRVTSKGGTTAAAIEVFNTEAVDAAIAQGVAAAAARGRELCDILGAD